MAKDYDRLLPALKSALPAAVLSSTARSVGFVRRLRTVEAALFVWAVVLSRFGQQRPGFAQAQHVYEALGGAVVCRRPFQKRFLSTAAVELLEQAFRLAVAALEQRPRVTHPLGKFFPDIVAWDSTLMQVNDALRRVLKGTRSTAASVKAAVAVSVFGLLPRYACVTKGSRHDAKLFPPLKRFAKGTLLLFDKGFVAYDRLRQLGEAGMHFLCPMRLNGNARIVACRSAPMAVRKKLRSEGCLLLRQALKKGKTIGRAWDLDVLVTPGDSAKNHRPVRVRLVIVPGPKGEQRPYLTNLSPRWTPDAVRELYRLRWQVELVFKELKQHVSLEKLPSKDHRAVMCFVWASLTALAVSRTVYAWAAGSAIAYGLQAKLRPELLTRALRATGRMLVRAIHLGGAEAAALIAVLRHELLREAAAYETDRQDSLSRMRRLLPCGA